MASSRVPPSKPLELDLTIVNAKHLKNVNWKNGDLKPYAIFWVDPDRRLATKSDDCGSTRPVWNEQFTIPLALPLPDSVLSLEVFHSKPSETPKPLVGSLLIHLKDLPDPQDKDQIRTYELIRPSGRPHGKIRIKLAVRERPVPPEYVIPPSGYYYATAPPPPHPTSRYLHPQLAPLPVARAVTMPPPPPNTVREYRPYSVPTYAAAPPPPPAPAQSPPAYSYSYSDAYSGYYPGHYSSAPPPPPPRPFYDRGLGYGGPSSGPSAPIDYTTAYEKQRNGKMGLGAGLAVGAVAGALGGLALEEELNYEEEEKISERAGSDMAAKDSYCDYRDDY
ncbi:C2 domain-containing protein [Psidium guajava]|nr:C2 domain-containing protein [Psidium guajava]